MNQVKIAWYGIHQGEEPPLIPAGGIFFSGCDMHCVFCQNYQISQHGLGNFYSNEELADIMIKLQNDGAANIDLVTPTTWHKQIKQAILSAKEKGLKIPIVWNGNGYEDLEIIKSMADLVDIYLPDFKYGKNELALKYSGAKNYFETATKVIKEMLRQVGYLKIVNGKAARGLIVRHLVLPNCLENSFEALKRLAEIDIDIHISLMNQYLPTRQVNNFPELKEKVSQKDFQKIYDYLLGIGFHNGWTQGENSQENLTPDFTKSEPFG
ncbi:MAG: radical SAM protein [Patescibacteria group bacterium]|nr:radical SAM protein [Patescibacteria group bacterium]